MEREYSQLELFSKDKEQDLSSQMPVSLRDFLKRFEKTVLVLIGFIVTAAIGFSLGVEKGKSLASVVRQPRFDLAKGAQRRIQEPAVKVLRPVAPAAAPAQPAIQIQKQPQIQYGWFTIQVASYQDRIHAQKEKEDLIKKGFSPQLLSKGGYTVVCVGNFKEKENARSLLSQLRLRYRDCYIRRL